MRMKIIVISSMLCLIVGCSSENNQSNNQDTSPQTSDTRYVSDENKRQQIKDTQDGKNPGLENHATKNDIFTSDKSIRIQETLTNRRDVRRAQVAITNTRAIIAVQLNDNADREGILDSIENEVKHIVPNKEMVIYTDDSYWNRMKDLGSKLKKLTDDDDIDEYINNHFFE